MLLLLLMVVPMTVLYQQQVTRIQSAQILENKTLHRGTCTTLFSDTQSTDKILLHYGNGHNNSSFGRFKTLGH